MSKRTAWRFALAALVTATGMWWLWSTTLSAPLRVPTAICTQRQLDHAHRHHGDDAGHWRRMLQSGIPKSLLRREGEAIPTSVPSAFVPEAVKDPLGGDLEPPTNAYVVEALFGGDIVVTNCREWMAARRLYESLQVLVSLNDERLIAWLAEQSETFPPRRLDAIVWIALNSREWSGAPRAFWEATAPDWRRMWQGNNGVYRLIALGQAPWWTRSPDELDAVLKDAAGEEETMFQKEVLERIELEMMRIDNKLVKGSANMPSDAASIVQRHGQILRDLARGEGYPAHRARELLEKLEGMASP